MFSGLEKADYICCIYNNWSITLRNASGPPFQTLLCMKNYFFKAEDRSALNPVRPQAVGQLCQVLSSAASEPASVGQLWWRRSGVSVDQMWRQGEICGLFSRRGDRLEQRVLEGHEDFERYGYMVASMIILKKN